MKLALNRRNFSSLVQAPMRCWNTNSASNFRGLKKESFESKQHVCFCCFRRVFARDVERWD